MEEKVGIICKAETVFAYAVDYFFCAEDQFAK